MLCHNSLISMSTHKAHAARWPSSEHLPSEHLQPALKKAHIRCTLHFATSQLPDHLYISQRILFNKGTHKGKNLISLMPSYYDTYLRNFSKMYSTKYDFSIPDLLCPKLLIITRVA